MRRSELSREALAALELIPAWTLRAPYVPSTETAFKNDFLALVVAGDDQAKQLWGRITEAMVRARFHPDWMAQTVVLPSIQTEQLRAMLSERRPRVVLLFGKTLSNAITALESELTQGVDLIIAPELSDMLKSGAVKSRLWPLLCGLPAKLAPLSK